MAKYRKKPVVIEAYQFSGPGEHLTIHTLEGDMRADLGDWIIRGIKGELYPCKDEIFRATYELVTEEDRGEISGPKDGLSVGLDPLLTRE
jgi:hypothetical protein